MLTKNGICYDLDITPYAVETETGIYYFSSRFYMEKFKEELKQNRDTINSSLKNRFNVSIVFNSLCDIVLYSRIEKRGFKIYRNGVFYKCLTEVELNG